MPPRHQRLGDGLSDHRAEARSAPSAERHREAGGTPLTGPQPSEGAQPGRQASLRMVLQKSSSAASNMRLCPASKEADANAWSFHRILLESSSGFQAHNET